MGKPIKSDGRIDNEVTAFADLVTDSQGAHNLGVQSSIQLKKIYRQVRHKLIHLLAPYRGNLMATYFPEEPASGRCFEEVKAQIKSENEPSIEQKQDALYCHIDRLNRDLAEIAQWLQEFIADCDEPSVERALMWLKKQLGD